MCFFVPKQNKNPAGLPMLLGHIQGITKCDNIVV